MKLEGALGLGLALIYEEVEDDTDSLRGLCHGANSDVGAGARIRAKDRPEFLRAGALSRSRSRSRSLGQDRLDSRGEEDRSGGGPCCRRAEYKYFVRTGLTEAMRTARVGVPRLARGARAFLVPCSVREQAARLRSLRGAAGEEPRDGYIPGCWCMFAWGEQMKWSYVKICFTYWYLLARSHLARP